MWNQKDINIDDGSNDSLDFPGDFFKTGLAFFRNAQQPGS
jgi:hypothetical protein